MSATICSRAHCLVGGSRWGRMELVKLLLEQGASRDGKRRGVGEAVGRPQPSLRAELRDCSILAVRFESENSPDTVSGDGASDF
jgi:hypothetical protein